jgi:hypothetical protein
MGKAQGIFRAVELFCMIYTMMEPLSLYICHKSEYPAPREQLNINHGLWVTMMYQYRSLILQMSHRQDICSWKTD